MFVIKLQRCVFDYVMINSFSVKLIISSFILLSEATGWFVFQVGGKHLVLIES